MRRLSLATLAGLALASTAQAALVTDPNDARNWQGATVGTFALLYYGANNPTTRAQVVSNQLLDDGTFNSTGFAGANLLSAGGSGGCLGTSSDTTGTGSLAYSCGGGSVATYANGIDNLWFQTSGVVGQTVFDLESQ